MKVSVARNPLNTVVPDFAGNLELPEAEQWQIVLRQPAKYKASLTTMIVGGEVVSKFDTADFVESWVVRHVNPPDIEIDGKITRPLRTSDLFDFDEFDPVVQQVMNIINKVNQEEPDLKN